MITAYQTTLDDTIAPERLVKFGRIRRAISIAVIEDERGLRVEVRLGRKLLSRVECGDDRAALLSAVGCANNLAAHEMLGAL